MASPSRTVPDRPIKPGYPPVDPKPVKSPKPVKAPKSRASKKRKG